MSKVKLSDFIASFISKKGVKSVFAISGGASLHLIHSIDANPDIKYICTHHEQGAAMAADSFSRVSGNIGVAIATSGPGATNLITGICCSYYDSVPLLIITGQVSTFRMTGGTGVRQIGFQETPISNITKEITKYSTTIQKADDIKYELEKAFYLANEGRPGPVLIDIPDNLQREIIDVDKLRSFKRTVIPKKKLFPSSHEQIQKIICEIKKSKRPVVVAGWGIHLSKTENQFLEFVNKYQLPVALTWGASDLIESENNLYIGTFGTHGMRHANFAVQNADLIISLGTRLDTKSTGSPITTFAREARKIMIDIDPAELSKFDSFGLSFDILVQDDLKEFFKCFQSQQLNLDKEISNNTWFKTLNNWKQKFKAIDEYENKADCSQIDPYIFFKKLSDEISFNTSLFIDTGCSIAWAMQSMNFKKGVRVFHDFNNTAMGWALPALIGGYFADPKRDHICIAGDGSFMMTMQELATVLHHKINLKLLIINNSGYSMIKQTQDQWLGSNYVASSEEGGLSFPDYQKISEAFKLDYIELSKNSDIDEKISKFLLTPNPVLMNVKIPKTSRVKPQVKFGRPNEDMEPLLPRNVFMENMLIKPLQVSLED